MYLNILKSIALNKLGVIKKPSFITFFNTWRCNCRCIFCDIWKKKEAKVDELSVDEVERIFKHLSRIDVLRISGGEPFLRRDLAEMVNRIDRVSRPSIIHLTTNGLLTDRIVSFIKKVKPSNKIHIKISIDNIGEKHDYIRGIPGAYKRAMDTIKELVTLRSYHGFHLGVNQAILNASEAVSYENLKAILSPYNVPIYAAIAHTGYNNLYSDSERKFDPSYRNFGDFHEDALRETMDRILKNSKENGNFSEYLVDKYYIRGLHNRLVGKKNWPNPKCVALNNHMRILPNGDVPVCFFNGQVVGNLRRETFEEIWHGAKIAAMREWVKKCPGCWESCEVAVSGIYTGDIWRGFL